MRVHYMFPFTLLFGCFIRSARLGCEMHTIGCLASLRLSYCDPALLQRTRARSGLPTTVKSAACSGCGMLAFLSRVSSRACESGMHTSMSWLFSPTCNSLSMALFVFETSNAFSMLVEWSCSTFELEYVSRNTVGEYLLSRVGNRACERARVA